MTKTELYLKTIFCCMACDGDIAKEEVDVVRCLSSGHEIFAGIDVETLLNKWIAEINSKGTTFLNAYLTDLSEAVLTADEQLEIVDLVIKTIEADNRIEYSEIKFFKKMRARLSVSDDEILKRNPDKEEFLLPDLNEADSSLWSNLKLPEIILNPLNADGRLG